jgi:CNT family concentrative nucleoside transporter
MIRPYLDKMTRSEILCIMVGGMANTAGSVLAAYVGFLGGDDPVQKSYFALHMLSQSIMSAPAAIVCAKLLFPQTDQHLISKDLAIPKEKLGDNFLDALSLGTTDGLKLAVNVGAMLIVYTAIVYLMNGLMGWFGDITHINSQIATATGGEYQKLSLQMILGYVFAPVAWLIGVHRVDMVSIGQLLGEKTILNEFVAYGSLGKMKAANAIHDPKSLLIANSSWRYQPVSAKPTEKFNGAWRESLDWWYNSLFNVRLYCRSSFSIKPTLCTLKAYLLLYHLTNYLENAVMSF